MHEDPTPGGHHGPESTSEAPPEDEAVQAAPAGDDDEGTQQAYLATDNQLGQ
ncbi:hypothetical protein [Vallicoccus soli]|uniref:hypothetical protein n=1 Tax=Vallicoccus soli TaxID=2339232 RepID=UPI001402376C|nr:hypothetical protein [Vallicoccus soli]